MTTTGTTMTARQWATDAALAVLATGADLALALVRPSLAWGKGRARGPASLRDRLAGSWAEWRCWPGCRYPRAVLAVVLGGNAGGNRPWRARAWLGLLVAFFTAVLRGHRVTAIASLVVGYVVSVWAATWSSTLLLAWGLATLLLVAELARARNARAAADRRGRAEATARLASEERLAMARDLHDVVAHSISVINVQANTALHRWTGSPSGLMRYSLPFVRSAARLWASSPPCSAHCGPETMPPGERRWPRCRGWPGWMSWRRGPRTVAFAVSVTAHGPVRPLPAGVDAAAYRIVQEALTNAVRHSVGRSATVQLDGPVRPGDRGSRRRDQRSRCARTRHPGGRAKPGRTRSGTGCGGWPSGRGRSAARSTRGPGRAAGSGCWRGCQGDRDDRGDAVIRVASPTTRSWSGRGSPPCSTPRTTSAWSAWRATASVRSLLARERHTGRDLDGHPNARPRRHRRDQGDRLATRPWRACTC